MPLQDMDLTGSDAKTATFTIVGCSPLVQSRYHGEPMLAREKADKYEDRTWPMRSHIDESGHVFLPSYSVKNCLVDAAVYAAIKTSGKGTISKHFRQGIMAAGDVTLDQTKDDIVKRTMFCPSDGKRGSGRRVIKHFPLLPSWSGEAKIYVIDPIIDMEVMARVLGVAGMFIGIGSYRPQNGGDNGRFTVENLKIENGFK